MQKLRIILGIITIYLLSSCLSPVIKSNKRTSVVNDQNTGNGGGEVPPIVDPPTPKPITCDANKILNSNNQCECKPGTSPVTTGKGFSCVVPLSCPEGSTLTANGQSCTCPENLSFDKVAGQCVALNALTCDGLHMSKGDVGCQCDPGYQLIFDGSNDVCEEQAAPKICPAFTDLSPDGNSCICQDQNSYWHEPSESCIKCDPSNPDIIVSELGECSCKGGMKFVAESQTCKQGCPQNSSESPSNPNECLCSGDFKWQDEASKTVCTPNCEGSSSRWGAFTTLAADLNSCECKAGYRKLEGDSTCNDCTGNPNVVSLSNGSCSCSSENLAYLAASKSCRNSFCKTTQKAITVDNVQVCKDLCQENPMIADTEGTGLCACPAGTIEVDGNCRPSFEPNFTLSSTAFSISGRISNPTTVALPPNTIPEYKVSWSGASRAFSTESTFSFSKVTNSSLAIAKNTSYDVTVCAKVGAFEGVGSHGCSTKAIRTGTVPTASECHLDSTYVRRSRSWGTECVPIADSNTVADTSRICIRTRAPTDYKQYFQVIDPLKGVKVHRGAYSSCADDDSKRTFTIYRSDRGTNDKLPVFFDDEVFLMNSHTKRFIKHVSGTLGPEATIWTGTVYNDPNSNEARFSLVPLDSSKNNQRIQFGDQFLIKAKSNRASELCVWMVLGSADGGIGSLYEPTCQTYKPDPNHANNRGSDAYKYGERQVFVFEKP